MKDVTRLMINKYALDKLKYDFMGYEFSDINQLSYHHLIIPKRHGGPTCVANGAILRKDTSHEYLHVIERYDYDTFLEITSEMLDINIKGYVDKENLQYIDELLCRFEEEHAETRTKKGKVIIKDKFKNRMLRK